MLLNRCVTVRVGNRCYSDPVPRARIFLRFHPSSVVVRLLFSEITNIERHRGGKEEVFYLVYAIAILLTRC